MHTTQDSSEQSALFPSVSPAMHNSSSFPINWVLTEQTCKTQQVSLVDTVKIKFKATTLTNEPGILRYKAFKYSILAWMPERLTCPYLA